MPDEAKPAWLLLRGTDATPTRPAPVRSRVVLLHGWLQDHGSWLKVAMALRDVYGHDCLLIDFWGHGHSPIPSATHLSDDSYTRLVEECCARCGWDSGPPLCLAGASLGAAVALRFTRDHPTRVARLTLVVPAGLPEPWYMPAHWLSRIALALADAAPRAVSLSWPVALLHAIRTLARQPRSQICLARRCSPPPRPRHPPPPRPQAPRRSTASVSRRWRL